MGPGHGYRRDGRALRLRADLPGVSEEDINLQMEDNVLTISGERTAEHETQEGYHRLERAFGGFSRSLTLPAGIDPHGVQAHFDRGVLEVRIPKPEQKKPGRSRSHSAPAQPGPERLRAPNRPTLRPTAAIRRRLPPDGWCRHATRR